jgi:2-keto-3-deoxy-L-rhamnonate aldolase RhmA
VEIVGFAGAEAVLIDTEHGMISTETVRSMMVHARAAGTAPVFRPTRFDPGLCRQALDQGAAGVHVPHIDTAEEARAVVNACRYAPLGRREMSLGRAVEYKGEQIRDYVATADENLLLTIMIESVKGLENVEEIAAVPGIDVIHLGVADLSHDMGHTGHYDHPEVNAAVDDVLDVAARHNIAVGYPTQDPDQVRDLTAKGMRFFEADTPDYLLREVYAKNLNALRKVFDAERA